MTRLLATIYKELLLLFRDRAGLLVLFFMPAVLVIIISLVQENVLKATGETNIQVLFLDQDSGLVGETIKNRLFGTGNIQFVRTIGGKTPDPSEVETSVVDGDFQMGIVVPKGTSKAMEAWIQRLIDSSFDGKENSAGMESSALPWVQVYFDPIAQGSFRTAVENGLHRIMLVLEMEMKARAVSKMVPEQADAIIRALTHTEQPEAIFPSMSADWGGKRAIDVLADRAVRGSAGTLPTSVQQNVPAWALFGMFFIVVPLGGSLIRERQGGTLARLLTMPTSYGILLMGKVIAYVLICLVQFSIILVIGKQVLPLLGTPVLEIGSAPEAMAAVVVSAALAACGYGILLGTIARTYEQASMFGAVSVVIAAAVGGIMVPVYVMPEMMRRISEYSPLAWGLNALTDIFAREGTLGTVQNEIVYLLAFAVGSMLLAWGWFVYHHSPS